MFNSKSLVVFVLAAIGSVHAAPVDIQSLGGGLPKVAVPSIPSGFIPAVPGNFADASNVLPRGLPLVGDLPVVGNVLGGSNKGSAGGILGSITGRALPVVGESPVVGSLLEDLPIGSILPEADDALEEVTPAVDSEVDEVSNVYEGI